ncbi:MAG TPA: hypothetical protein VE972_15080 [Conexibacter sp.]|nr:hypothetical protein [Conexibacter sp.]
MAEQWIVDPVDEDAGNTPLDLLAAPFAAAQFNTPTPGIDPRWTQPADADGDLLAGLRYVNREIKGSVEIVPAGGDAAAAQAALAQLADKVAKINREGGTLRRVMPSGDAITFDLLTADAIDPTWDATWESARAVSIDLGFTAKPFWRGVETAYGAHTETSLPALVFTETAPAGDVPALGRLVLTDAQSVSQGWATWGLQSAHYDAAATAALFYEAEACTPMGSAAVATVSGASGGGSNNVVTQASLSPTWTALLSTQGSGGGSHLTHVGDYRVLARVLRPSSNTGVVGIALEWGVGDFLSFTRNEATTYDVDVLEDAFTLVELGIVSLPEIANGSGRWEGRIVATSSVAGDQLSVDCLFLVPVEASGAVSCVLRSAAPTSLSARDEFNQTAGALSGKTLPVGGTWAGAGDTDDFVVDTASATAQRAVAGDLGNTGRWALAGSSTFATVAVSVDATLMNANTLTSQAVIARYVDTTHHVQGGFFVGNGWAFVYKRLGGGVIPIGQRLDLPVRLGIPWTIQLAVDASGRFAMWVAPAGSPLGDPVITGIDADLATGGALASGKVGLYDENGFGASTRSYDNFAVWVPVLDSAIFANQSLAIESARVVREDSTGTFWMPVSKYEGDLLTVPPAGPEGRHVRVIAKASRSVPDGGADSGVDDLTGQLYVTPRGLIVP